jgi:hypothetical protein
MQAYIDQLVAYTDAVIAALEFGDLGAPAESSGQPYGVQGCNQFHKNVSICVLL